MIPEYLPPYKEYDCTNEIFRGIFKAVESEFHTGPILDFSGKYEITDGYIHAYTGTGRYAHEWECLNDVIIKCIIPPGTKYYQSYDRDTICAQTLIIPKESRRFIIRKLKKRIGLLKTWKLKIKAFSMIRFAGV